MTREEWYKHKTLDAIQQLKVYVELIMNGNMASHMSDSETSKVYHGLSTLNSDITRSLLEMHSKQRNVKGENYENHCRRIDDED